jgi:mRNA interferase MazF
MTYNTWDIILVPFPFTNLRSVKKRPALIISPNSYNSDKDVVILFITSNINSYPKIGDHLIDFWKESGLPKPSMTRMKFATISTTIIVKNIGSLHNSDRFVIKEKLQTFFGL